MCQLVGKPIWPIDLLVKKLRSRISGSLFHDIYGIDGTSATALRSFLTSSYIHSFAREVAMRLSTGVKNEEAASFLLP